MADEDQKDPWAAAFSQAAASEAAAADPAKDQAPAADAAPPIPTPPATPPAPPQLNAPPSEAPDNAWANAFSQAAPLEAPRYGTVAPKRPDVHSGVADEDLIKSFGYDPKTIYKSPTYQLLKDKLGTGFGFMLAAKTGDDALGGVLRSPLGAAGQGAMDTLLGIAQLGAHLVGEKDDRPYMDLLTKVADENYLQNIQRGQDPAWYNKLTRAAAPALVPVGGEALEGASLLPAIARGTATGAALGLAQPVYTDPNDPNSYAKGVAANTAFGAAGGTGGAALARGLSGSVGRIASMFKTPLPEDAAADMATRLHGAMNGSWGDLSDLQNVSDPRLAARARTASDAIANAGSDPTKIEQAVVKLQNFRTAAQANQLYDQVGQLAAGAQVPVTHSLATMQKLLKELPESVDENIPLINSIKGWMGNLQPKTVEPEPPPGVMGNIQAYANWKAANRAVTAPGRNLYSQLREYSSDLGDMIDSGMSGEHGLIAPQSVRRLQQIKDAVDEDLRNFTQSSAAPPALQQAAQAADNYYRAYRAPFLDRSIAKAGTTDMPDTLFGMFVRGGDHADLAEKFYNILTPKGRSAVQSQLLDRVINDSTPATATKIVGKPPTEPPRIDAAAFINNLNRYKPALNVFFQGKDQQALSGVENLIRHYATATDKGKIPLGILAGAATGLLGHHIGLPYQADVAGGTAIGGAAIKWLMNTDAGRKVAANAFALKPATPEMAALWGKLLPMVPYISRFGATGAVGSTRGPIIVKPFRPPSGFAGGGLALKERMRRNTLESLRPSK